MVSCDLMWAGRAVKLENQVLYWKITVQLKPVTKIRGSFLHPQPQLRLLSLDMHFQLGLTIWRM